MAHCRPCYEGSDCVGPVPKCDRCTRMNIHTTWCLHDDPDGLIMPHVLQNYFRRIDWIYRPPSPIRDERRKIYGPYPSEAYPFPRRSENQLKRQRPSFPGARLRVPPTHSSQPFPHQSENQLEKQRPSFPGARLRNSPTYPYSRTGNHSRNKFTPLTLRGSEESIGSASASRSDSNHHSPSSASSFSSSMDLDAPESDNQINDQQESTAIDEQPVPSEPESHLSSPPPSQLRPEAPVPLRRSAHLVK